ncbi:MAG TPA: branched-chain amino acid ABC transporter permease [Desulfonatronum sp.]|nr:branched-chain amino acid ABC transporter permease [Desulfonatronum sp.]
MHQTTSTASHPRGSLELVRRFFANVPLLAWFCGALVAVILERAVGLSMAQSLGMPRIPVLFGFLVFLKQPALIPGALGYVLLMNILPICITAKIGAPVFNLVSRILYKMPLVVTALVHLAVLYAVFHFWADVNAYRMIMLKMMLISILLTLSLNVINGYMGEFSCSHPGFMALGAYAASLFTVGLFVNDQLFGPAMMTSDYAVVFFPLGLFFTGLVSALGALVIAIPSFKTRGDYLAIISLAFTFIIKSVLENLEFLGGPRGLSGQPDWSSLPMVFIIVVFGVWVINNFVTSTMGKALNAVRDDEIAAEAMTVDTRKTKIIAFMFAAFWAGVAGGLFAHVLRFVNPSTFGIQKLAEVLAMVYFGGLNSVYGSIVGAVSISLLGEALRPLEILKWIIIPLLLILVMIFRPRGLISFKEFNIHNLLKPRG